MAQNNLPAISAGENGLQRYLDKIRRFPMLEPQEEYMLAKRYSEHEDPDAAHRLVSSHLRLVAKIAMGYRGYGLPISEVISEGNVGLMQAVKRFDPEKGFRLATYAMWWIKAAIQEYILRSWSLVKMGTTANQKRLFFNLRKIKIRQGADGGEWQDWLVDESDSQEKLLAEQEELDMRRKMLSEALEVLNERERRIFEARRLAEDPLTLEALSEEFGVSRERVRQIEVRAFEKVQKIMRKRAAQLEQQHMIEAQ